MRENPLGTQTIPKLLTKMAVPSVIANLVNALYNVVDQIFIGHTIGYSGNAATNIAFPLTTLCLAIGLMTGLGAAAGFNLELGRGDREQSRRFAGTAFSSLWISGVVIAVAVRLSLDPLMLAFGGSNASPEIMRYVTEYAGITSLGIPFLLFSVGAAPLVRGDGSPGYSMAALVTGSAVNIGLDALFMLVFGMGMRGAAWATVIGQAICAGMLAIYFLRFKNVKIAPRDLVPNIRVLGRILALGFSSFAFQSSTLLIQITVNNLLGKYGDLSIYGSDVTIAAAGILQKLNAIFIAMVIGVVQGAQPILSYNYGAKKFHRVRKTVRLSLIVTTSIAVSMFLLMQLFPGQIVGLFGGGSKLYFEFAVIFARGFMLCTFLNGAQIFCATFFPAIGKAAKGAIISLSKQLAFLLPLLLLLPRFFGIYGVIYAAPVSDTLAFLLAGGMLLFELKAMPKEDQSVPEKN